MSPDPKRQHYVPRSYLALFTDPGTPEGHEPYLWVYTRGGSRPFARAPKKLAVRKYYYSFAPDEEDLDHAVEELLGNVESRAIPLVKQLAAGECPDGLSEEDRAWLSYFIGLLSVRVPGFRDSVEGFAEELMRKVGLLSAQHPEHFESTMRRASTAQGKDPPENIEEIRQFVLSGEYEVKASPLLSLQMFMSLAPTVAEYVTNYRWRILRVGGEARFVTSDRPVVNVTTKRQPAILGAGAGWETPWMEATLPLSPRSCLLISLHHPEGEEEVGDEIVREVNTRTAAFAAEVYSSQKVVLGGLDRDMDRDWWTPVTDALVEADGE